MIQDLLQKLAFAKNKTNHFQNCFVKQLMRSREDHGTTQKIPCSTRQSLREPSKSNKQN